jgi:hypothetical protein
MVKIKDGLAQAPQWQKLFAIVGLGLFIVTQ